MNFQKSIISKEYYGFNHFRIGTLLKIDDDLNLYFNELKEIYEDAFDIAEQYIHKDIAYTLNEYKFFNVNTNKIVIDEGNYLNVSAITSDGNNITGYTVLYNTDKFEITFNSPVNSKELSIKFYCGYRNSNDLNKSIRRAIYIIINDLYDWEKSSYTIQASKKTDVIERYLNPFVKRFWLK